MKPLKPLSGEKRPLFFAHRGASSLAPENTLAAFALARDLGSPGIELDIHRCASGELVVFHDDDLSRIAGSPDAIAETSLSRLKEIDIGSWKGKEFSGERVPTLRELFEAMGASVYYDIEIKCRVKERTGVEKDLSDMIDEFSLAERVCVSCFNPFPLLYLKEIRKDIATAIIWCVSDELPYILRYGAGAFISHCDFLKPDHAVMDGFNVLRLGLGRKRAVVPWTVDDPETAKRLLDQGCSGIVTNRIQDMRGLLA
jgi:glycerophosphoryl diester phosphodiesterase